MLVSAALMSLSLTGCSGADETSRREQAFRQVWERINTSFYDETFGGRDWAAIGDRFHDAAMQPPSEKNFFIKINEMLFELRVSHIGVIPNDHPEWIGAPSSFADGEVGLDIRIVDDQIVVTRRKPAIGDDEPDLVPGTIITRVHGKTLSDFINEASEPPVPAIPTVLLATEKIAAELFRNAGETVSLTYLDGDGAEKQASLVAVERDGAVELLEGIPPVYLEFETKNVRDSIGYIRFNSFHMALLDQILTAIRHHHGMAGLIVDLRGNSGGDFKVRRAIAEHLILQESLVWRYANRFGTDDIVLEPADGAYRGEVVFLVDELSASSAEELSGAMQALGRAKVVGNTTAGLVLVAGVEQLEIGATLVYPTAETQFVNGYVPEGKGIRPDVTVPYSIGQLKEGLDAQLEAAIRVIEGNSL